jgi:hypothetical protein
MQYLSAIGNAATTAHNFSGNLIGSIFDGIGALQSKVLGLGGDRLLAAAIPLGIAYTFGNNKKFDFGVILVLSGLSGLVYALSSTRMLFEPVTGEIVKRSFSTAVLTAIDTYAMHKFFRAPEAQKKIVSKNWKKRESKTQEKGTNSPKFGAMIYLALRSLDLLANFGAVSEGFTRLNPAPLIGNVKSIIGWVR